MDAPFRRLTAVMFDWAGTTIDHGSRAPTLVFVEIFRRHGIAITEAEARGPMGRAKRDHLATVAALPRVASAWRERYGRDCHDEDIERMYADFLPLQKETLAAHSDVIPGIPEVVAACRRRGLKIGSSTGYTRELMDVVTPIARAQGYEADVVMTADDVPQGRPAPWLLFRAAQSLNVYPVQSIVVVDDTEVGIQAGRNAGMRTVAVTRTGNSLGLTVEEVAALAPDERDRRLSLASHRFREIGADYVIESVADLLPVLNEMDQAR